MPVSRSFIVIAGVAGVVIARGEEAPDGSVVVCSLSPDGSADLSSTRWVPWPSLDVLLTALGHSVIVSLGFEPTVYWLS